MKSRPVGDNLSGGDRYGGAVTLVENYRSSDRRRPFLFDAVSAAVLAVLAIANAIANKALYRISATTICSILCACLALSLRRRVPFTAFAVATLTFTTIFFRKADGTAESVAFWATLYTVGTIGAASRFTPAILRSDRLLRSGARGIGVAVASVAVAIALATGQLDEPNDTVSLADSLFTLLLAVVFTGSGWFIGDLVRLRRNNERILAERNDELMQERETNARRAVLDERVRIARELHDVVAHHVSLMGVQAGAARLALRQRPEKAEAALGEVERSSRQAVAELHRLLGFLRQDELDSTAPQPTLADLDHLISDVKRAGREVTFVKRVTDAEVSTSMQLTAFRIVQEALTNALKHSSLAPIDVSLTQGTDALRVVVHDHGKPLRPPNKAPGRITHGLAGIRERVAFHGGTLAIGPTNNGFTVDAALPLMNA